MNTPLLQLVGASISFQRRTVLDQVDLTLARGEITTLIGPNGAGKTTLVRIVLGLLKPDTGQRQMIPNLTIGYMPQKLHVEPTMPLSVGRFLELAGANKQAICAALTKTGTPHVINSSLKNISGGEMQRVLLARALLRKPDLLVLDEPVQGVDVNGQKELYHLIGQLRDDTGCGVLMVSHDLHLVMAATDWVICLNSHVCCSGHPRQVSQHPAYLKLFGGESEELAVYSHHHNHRHDAGGEIIPNTATDSSATTPSRTRSHAGISA